jgi:hypothetical protein
MSLGARGLIVALRDFADAPKDAGRNFQVTKLCYCVATSVRFRTRGVLELFANTELVCSVKYYTVVDYMSDPRFFRKECALCNIIIIIIIIIIIY